jgi:hypothetical protein
MVLGQFSDICAYVQNVGVILINVGAILLGADLKWGQFC